MSLWSTIKSTVSSLFKKEDDKKSSSSSTSKTSIAGSAYSTKPTTKASKKPTSSKTTTSSSKSTPSTAYSSKTKTSKASTPKTTTTHAKSKSSSSSSAKSTSSSSSGVPVYTPTKYTPIATQQTPAFKGLLESSSSSNSSESSEPDKPKFNVDPQYSTLKIKGKAQNTKPFYQSQIPAYTQTALAKETIASTLPGAEDAAKPREIYTEDNRHSWTTYKVNTAQVSDAEYINKGLSDGSIEIWNVVKGDAFKTEAKYAEGVTEIGRERLDGLTDKDRVVYYDTKTGKIYKMAQGSEEYNNAQRKAQTYAGLIETLDNNKSKAIDAYTSYATTAEALEAYTTKLKGMQEKGQSISEKQWDEYEALYAEYTSASETLFGKSTSEDKSREAWEEYKKLQQEVSAWSGRGVPAQYGMKAEDYARYTELKETFSGSQIGDWYDYAATRERYVNEYMDAKKIIDSEAMSIADYSKYLSYVDTISRLPSTMSPQSALSKADYAEYLELRERVANGATYIPGEDWDAQMNQYCDQLEETKRMYEEYQKYFADATSDTQVNSLKDVIARMTGRLIWDQTFGDEVLSDGYTGAWYQRLGRTLTGAVQDYKEMTSYLVTPIKYAAQEWATNRALNETQTEEDAAVRAESRKNFLPGLWASYQASIYISNGLEVPEDIMRQIAASEGSFAGMFKGTDIAEVVTWTKNLGAVALNNYLINLGETADITNMFIKPFAIGGVLWDQRNSPDQHNPAYEKYITIMNDELEGDGYKNSGLANLSTFMRTVPATGEVTGSPGYTVRDVAGTLALKATWGGYGTTPSFEYDQVMHENGEEMGFWKSLFLTLPLEITLDPGTFLSFGGKAATKSVIASSADEVLDGVRNVYRAAGFTDEIIDGLDDDIAKKVSKAMYDDVEAVLKKASGTDDIWQDAVKKFFTGDSLDDRLAKSFKEIFTSDVSKHAADVADAARLDAVTKSMDIVPVNPTREAMFSAVPKTYREAFNDAHILTQRSIDKQIADTLANNKAATGALKLDTSYRIAASIHNTRYRLDKLEDVMRAVAMPYLCAVPQLAGKGYKALKSYMQLGKLSKNATDEFSVAAIRITGKVAGAMEDVKIADDLQHVISGLEEDFATIDAAVGHTKAHNYRTEVIQTLYTDVLNREFKPYQQIISNPGLSNARKLEILDEKISALTDGKWSSFRDYVLHYDADIKQGDLGKYLGKANIAQIEQLKMAYNEIFVLDKYDSANLLSNNVQSANALISQSIAPMIKAASDMTTTGVLTYDTATELMLLEDQTCTAIDLILNSPARGKFVSEFTGLELDLERFKEIIRRISSASSFGDVKGTQDALSDLIDSGIIDRIDAEASKYLDALEFKKTQYMTHLHRVADALEPVKVTTPEQLNREAFGASFFDALQKIYSVDEAGKREIIEKTIIDSANAFVLPDGTIDTDAFTRAYTVQFSQAVEHAIMLGNSELSDLSNAILDPMDTTGSLLRTLYNSAVASSNNEAADAVQALISAAAEHKASREFVEAIGNVPNKSDAAALLDGYATSVSYINAVFKNTDIDNAAARVQAEQSVVQQIMDAANRFMNGTGRQDFHCWEAGCNTLDTAANVRKIQELFADPEYRALLELGDDDQFIDVVFSMDTVTQGADPFMISFGVGGEVRTFRNAEVSYNVHQNHVYDMHGMSEADAIAALEAIDYEGVSQREFRNQLDNYMYNLAQQAAAEGKTVRFIGFNNSSAYTDQNRYLRRLNSRNSFGVNITEVVDVGDALRAQKGIVKISDDSKACLEKAVHQSFTTGKINTAVMGVGTGIAYDVHTDMGAMASRMSLSFPSVNEFDKVGLDRIVKRAEQGMSTIRIENGRGLGELSDVLIDQKALDEVVHNYCSMGKSQHVNVMAVLRQMAHDNPAIQNGYNLYKVIDKQLVESWFDAAELQHVLDDMIDGDTVSKLDKVTHIVKAIDSTHNAIAVPELIDDIDGGQGVFKDLFQVMHNEACTRSAQFFEGKQLASLQVVGSMKYTTPQEYFAAITYIRTQYSELFATTNCMRTAKAVDSFCAATGKTVAYDELIADALRLTEPGTADALVFNRGNITDFSRSGITLRNKYSDTLAAVNRVHAAEKAYANAEYVKDFESYLHTIGAVNEVADAYTAREIMLRKQFEEVFAPYRTMMEDFNDRILSIDDYVPTFNLSSPEGYYASANYARNQAAEALKRSTAALERFHQDGVVKTVLTMSDDDFETHVVRNCKNALIIDPRASVFQSSPTNMKLLMSRIESLQKSGRLVVERSDDGLIRIYKNLAGVDMDELFEEYSKRTTEVSGRYLEYQRTVNAELGAFEKDFRGMCKRAGIKSSMPYAEQQARKAEVIERMLSNYNGELDKEFLRSMLESEGFLASKTFTDALDKMSKHMAADYMVSDLETMTQDTMQLIQEGFPVESRLDAAGRFNDWFTEAYNCSVIADMDVKKQFNPYASSSVVNNMGNGLHHVRNKMEATTNYLAMFDNETQSIGFMCDEIERRGGAKVRAKDVQRALKSDGYTLATCFVDEQGRYTVEKVELMGDKHLAALRKHKNVICVSNEEFLEIQECAKALDKKWFADHASAFNKTLANMVDVWANTTRNLRVTGYLFGMPFGAALRNKVDATWKAVNSAGVGVLKYIATARETKSRYEDVVSDILKSGKQLNMKSIQEYFADVTTTKHIDLDTFMKVYAFDSSNAAGLANIFEMKSKMQTEKLTGMLRNNAASTLAAIDDIQLTRYVDVAKSMFQHEYNADMWRVVDSTKHGKAQMVNDVLARMAKNKELKALSDAQRKELADMFYHYTPNSTAWTNAVTNAPILGYIPFFESKTSDVKHGLVSMNMSMFSNVESDTRLGLAMYYMDQLGYSANKANIEVINSQFNYNSRSKFVENVDKLFPFSTFKLYNAKYWLMDSIKNANTLKYATKISRAQGYVLDEETEAAMIRNMVYRQKLRNGLVQLAEDVATGRTDAGTAAEFVASLNAGIGEAFNEYNGIPKAYSRGIPVGGEVQATRTDPITGKEVTYTYRHVLKVGNSFVDAMDLLDNCMMFPLEVAGMIDGLANNKPFSVPTLFADNVYSPIATIAAAYNAYRTYRINAAHPEDGTAAEDVSLSDYLERGTEHRIRYLTDYDNPYYDDEGNVKYHVYAYEYDEEVGFLDWCVENNYDIIDMVPFVGALCNAFNTYIKNANLNLHKLGLMNIFPNLKEDFVGNAMTQLSNVAGTVAPGFVGVEYTKVRTYDTHLASFWSKDAVTYIDWVGKYEKMGFTKEEIFGNEAKGIVGIFAYLFGSNDSHTLIPEDQLNGIRTDDNPFTYQNKQGEWGVNIDLLNDTLLELIAKGYTAQEAMQLICDESDVRWFDPKTGDLLSRSKARDKLYSSEALMLYGQLPDYVKYDKNMYSDLYEYYTQLGYSYKDAYNIIATKHPYFDEQGYIRYYSDAQFAVKEQQMADDWDAYNAELPSFMKYEPGAATRTAQYVMEHFKLDYDDAYNYIIKNNVYVDYDDEGNPVMHMYTAKQVKKLNDEQAKEFKEYYNQLPTYVKYGKGLYSDTLQYLKSIGFDNETAKKFIMNGACYLKDQERLIDCTGMSRPKTGYSKYMNDDQFKAYYNSIPEYTRYESGAYKRTYAYLKAQGYKYEQITQMIKDGAYLTEGGVLINVVELGMTGDTKTAYNRTVDYLKKQGLDDAKIRELIQAGYYLNDKGQMLNLIEAGIAKVNPLWRQVEFNDYYNTLPEVTRYEKGAYARTLAYLKKQGYTEDQAKVMIQQGAYLDANGKLTNVMGMKSPNKFLTDEEFTAYYNTIPEYTRYEKGGFSRVYQYLKEKGYQYGAILQMIKDGFYVTTDGKEMNVKGMTRPRRSYSKHSYGKRGGYYAHSGNTRRFNRYTKPKQKKPIKHYYKQNKVKKPYVTNGSYSSTYSLVNKLHGQNYGMRKIYKVNLGVSPVRKSLSIKSTYPASYRNVVYSNRRSMYREQYAKYGLSRMSMRSGVWHPYSNASTVRLRREAVQFKMRYSGFRARF